MWYKSTPLRLPKVILFKNYWPSTRPAAGRPDHRQRDRRRQTPASAKQYWPISRASDNRLFELIIKACRRHNRAAQDVLGEIYAKRRILKRWKLLVKGNSSPKQRNSSKRKHRQTRTICAHGPLKFLSSFRHAASRPGKATSLLRLRPSRVVLRPPSTELRGGVRILPVRRPAASTTSCSRRRVSCRDRVLPAREGLCNLSLTATACSRCSYYSGCDFENAAQFNGLAAVRLSLCQSVPSAYSSWLARGQYATRSAYISALAWITSERRSAVNLVSHAAADKAAKYNGLTTDKYAHISLGCHRNGGHLPSSSHQIDIGDLETATSEGDAR